MLTKTSMSAIRALIFIAQANQGETISPRQIAESINESPTYMAKITRQLVKARILTVQRGVKGGVQLYHAPESVTLLAIVEACQGAIVGDFCRETNDLESTCAYHHAGMELYEAIVGVLSRWTLADLLAKPHPSGRLSNNARCWLSSSSQIPTLSPPLTLNLITKRNVEE